MGRVIDRNLPSDPASLAQARLLIDRSDLGEAASRERLKLALTEVLGNAVRHGSPSGSQILLRITERPGIVHVEVIDQGPCFERHEQRPTPGPGRGGFGLRVLEDVADTWAVERTSEGCVVSFDIATGAAFPA
jgi:anti-sigma regulatory factor (Ser/Thr protein kinase)